MVLENRMIREKGKEELGNLTGRIWRNGRFLERRGAPTEPLTCDG